MSLQEAQDGSALKARHIHPSAIRRAALASVAVICSAAAAPDTSSNVTLEQIIVTAKKRRENQQNVPQTVDVISGAALRKFSLTQFQDVQLLVSGLTLSDNGGQGQNISLRGITYDPDTAANPAVDVYVNEVPVSQTSSVFQDLYDVDDVEVVRGPQGTLRGRTSPAGAILIDTARPSLDAWHGYAQQIFATGGRFQTQLAAGGPIIQDKLAVRIAGLFDQNQLYQTRDIVTGQNDYNLQHSWRVTVEAKPTDELSVTLTHQDSNDRTRELFAVAGDGSQGLIQPSDNEAVVPGPYTFYDRTSLTTLQASYDLGDNELTYVGGYQAIKDEFSNWQDQGDLLGRFPSGSQQEDNGLEQLTQELRFQSTGEQRFGYMIGLYYAHQDADAAVFTPSETLFTPDLKPITEVNADVRIPQLVTDYAIFTDETFRLTADDIFEGGLRWQFERQYRASSYVVNIPPIFGGGTIAQQLISPQNQHEEYRAWTGLASYTHHFDKNTIIYATYGQSFRPGGVVLGESLPLPENFLTYRPETSYDFEIGTKTELFDGRVRLNGDIFHQAYSGYIGRLANLYTYLGYSSVTTNGNAIAEGAEFSADAFLAEGWRLRFNATYDNSHYDNAALPCNDFNGSGQPNTNGAPRVVPAGAIASTCLVNASLGAPNWYFSLNTEYDQPITDRLEGFVRALYDFTPANHLGLQAVNQDPRNIANLYLGVRRPDGRWEADFFVRNLFGVTGFTNLTGQQIVSGYILPQVTFVNLPTGYEQSSIQRPRQFGLTLNYRF